MIAKKICRVNEDLSTEPDYMSPQRWDQEMIAASPESNKSNRREAS